MLDSLRPTTGLLAGLALWALGLLVMAVLGLGSRFGPHPDNPSLAPALPVVTLDRGGARLGPAADYLEVGTRPLLSADRRPPPVVAAAGGVDAGAPLEAVLTSVLIAGQLKLALLQEGNSGITRRVRLGETLEGTAWRLVALEPRRAVFEGPGGQRVLDLRVYDGKGGAAPTPTAGAATATSPGAPLAATPAEELAAALDVIQPPANPPPGAAPEPAPENEAQAQDAQVEAIRRRIEARRAQMRSEAARNAGQKVE